MNLQLKIRKRELLKLKDSIDTTEKIRKLSANKSGLYIESFLVVGMTSQ